MSGYNRTSMNSIVGRLSATLSIDIDTYTYGHNEFVENGILPDSIAWGHICIIDGNSNLIDITQQQLNMLVYKEDKLTLISYTGVYRKEFINPGGFTLQAVLDSILEVESVSRLDADEGVSHLDSGFDVHHIFFEGLDCAEKGIYEIMFGS